MRNLKIKLSPVWYKGTRLVNPKAVLNGTGKTMFLWVGDETGVYSFTESPRELRRFAESILRRLGKGKGQRNGGRGIK